ncbi:MAG: VTT domain-containing protein [Bacteroidetes bacterium]|nr:VTT domain-containing protein [Bacteroidota bacterium]
MFVMPLLTSSLLTAWAIGYEAWWAALSLENWIFLTIALALASSLAMVPPGYLALVYGYFLGWIGLPLIILLNMAAIGLVYGLGKKLIPPAFLGQLQEAYPAAAKVLLRFHENPVRLIFFTKLSPVLPFAVTNLLFALAGARLPQMLLGGALGMVPRTILSLWIGTKAKEIKYLLENPNEDPSTQLLIVALVLFSTLGIGWFFKKK